MAKEFSIETSMAKKKKKQIIINESLNYEFNYILVKSFASALKRPWHTHIIHIWVHF